MEQIPDDPIIACMERTGYPPWFFYGRDLKARGYEVEDDVPDEDEEE